MLPWQCQDPLTPAPKRGAAALGVHSTPKHGARLAWDSSVAGEGSQELPLGWGHWRQALPAMTHAALPKLPLLQTQERAQSPKPALIWRFIS